MPDDRLDRLEAIAERFAHQMNRLAALVLPLADAVQRHDMLLSALASEHVAHAERLARMTQQVDLMVTMITRLDTAIERLDRLIGLLAYNHPPPPPTLPGL